MKRFEYANPTTVEEASAVLKRENSVLLAGGTDLVGTLKAKILMEVPDKVVSLRNIPELDYIKEDGGKLRIGAMTTLDTIAESPVVKKNWAALAEAAYSVASPNIRSMATLAGNLCQDSRCWYYRYPHQIGGRISCARKDGALCYAMMGDNRYHSIFGGVSVGDTACKKACPAGTNISTYMQKLRDGDVVGAASIIMDVNPMPSITSRVCAHFCQEKCNREQYDEKMNIGSIERFLGDYIVDHPETFMVPPTEENGKSVAIVGSGPAGLTAAFYLRQNGYKVTIFERMEKAGGALMYAIPAYRLPKEIVEKYIGRLAKMGIVFKLKTVIGEKGLTLDKLQQDYDSVMLDTGAWKRPLIGISGEELTHFGLDFLVAVNSYMQKRLGTNVIVVGGGNVAVDVAVTAKRLGAKKVTMVCLEGRDEMPAGEEEIERVLEAGCDLVNGWGPRIIKKNDNKVSGVEFMKCTQVFDETGRFAPQYDDCRLQEIAADVVFMAIGQAADLSFMEGVCKVETHAGRVKILNGNGTNVPGIFAAGDVTTGPATVIQAVKAGNDTAKQISDYLGGQPLRMDEASKLHCNCGDEVISRWLRFNPEYRNMVKYHRPDELPMEERTLDKEDVMGLNYEKVIAEAERCLNCGCVSSNPSDMANMLIAFRAKVRTNMRSLSVEELCAASARTSDILRKGEIVLEIEIPKYGNEMVAKYTKFRLRDSIDFAIAAVAWVCVTEKGKITDASLVLGAAAPVPYRALEAEKYLIGKAPNEIVLNEAAEIAMQDALPLPDNEYKINIFKTYIKRTLAN